MKSQQHAEDKEQTMPLIVNKPNGATPQVGQHIEHTNGTQQPVSPIMAEANGEKTAAAHISVHPAEVDPFDPKNYRKPQDPRLSPGAATATGLPATIDARKPNKAWFFRIHASPDYRAVLPVYTDDETKRRSANTYLFAPELAIPPDLDGLVRDTIVAAAINSLGVPFLYILTVSESSWYDSGIEVIQRATEEWVRVQAGDGCYIIIAPLAKLEEPRFPAVPFREWLERAFSKRLIKSLDDPLVKKLRGAR